MSPAASLQTMATADLGQPALSTLSTLAPSVLPPSLSPASTGLPPWLVHWRLRLGLASEVGSRDLIRRSLHALSTLFTAIDGSRLHLTFSVPVCWDAA